MKYLQPEDLRDIARGATFLGSGGGGDPEYACLLAEQYFEEYAPCALISITELAPDALVVPLAFMGAPLVSVEKLVSGAEFDPILEAITREYGRAPSALVAAEIGGSNALTPFIVGARAGLPVVDADAIGRAFPKLEMCALALQGVSPDPAFLACSMGRCVVLRNSTPQRVERFFRVVCEEMGSQALAALFIMQRDEARAKLLLGSVSMAQSIGKRLAQREFSLDVLGRGVIADIEQKIEGGFLKGRVHIKSPEAAYDVLFQNEYYALFRGEEPLVLTPDIIAILDRKSGAPLGVEQLRFGLEVELVGYPCHPIWKSPEGLELVGPHAFGLEVKR